MKVLNSRFAKHIEATYSLKIGDFHFFNHFLIAEFSQGCCVTSNDLTDIYDIASSFYRNKPYGFISNRIYSYSIDLVDFYKNSNKLNLIGSYAVVTYNDLSKKMLPMEDYYFKINRYRFNSLDNAVNWVLNEINQNPEVISDKSRQA